MISYCRENFWPIDFSHRLWLSWNNNATYRRYIFSPKQTAIIFLDDKIENEL